MTSTLNGHRVLAKAYIGEKGCRDWLAYYLERRGEFLIWFGEGDEIGPCRPVYADAIEYDPIKEARRLLLFFNKNARVKFA